MEEQALANAKQLLQAEMEALAAESDDREATFGAFSEALETIGSQIVYVPSKKAYGRASLQNKAELRAAAEHEHKTLREHMAAGVKKALKLEKKLTVVLGGYAVG